MMKRYFYTFAIPVLLSAAILAGCKTHPAAPPAGTTDVSHTESNTTEPATSSGDPKPSVPDPVKTVSLRAKETVFYLKDREVAGYDFTSCFVLTVNGEEQPIREEWLDHSLVKATPGTYEVICTYLTHQATTKIFVSKTNYTLTLLQKEISLTADAPATYDFTTLFEAKIDGEVKPITPEMISTDFRAEIGEYTYTVTNGNRSETLKIRVEDDHIVEILAANRSLSMTAEELRTADFKALFTVIVDGVQIPVTDSMLQNGIPETPQEGAKYRVGVRYSTEKKTYEAEITVTVSSAEDLVIRASDVETYPNAEPIDLTALFTILHNGIAVPVTQDMISGSVDYTQEGENVITLTYRVSGVEKTATATVTVKRGVVIRYAKADTVTIRQGTDPNTYPFAEDFIVLVNGIRFRDFPISMLDLSTVDFGTAGIYEATLTVRYNDKKLSLSGPNYSVYTKTIRYRVVENTYSVDVRSESVTLPKGTGSYNPFSNLNVVINGLRQTLTNDPNAETDSISCYAELISGAIDFGSPAEQTVTVAVYVNGRDEDPVTVSYRLRVESDVTVTAHDRALFAGGTISLGKLFSVTDAGKSVTVTYDMLTGTLDLNTPGTYRITIRYRDVEATATVEVLDRTILGTYHTALRNISEADDEDEEGYTISGTPSRQLDDLIIREDGTIRYDRTEGMITGGFGTGRMTAKFGSQIYTLYCSDGIVVLDPDNSLKMGFTNSKRPMVYFHEDRWEITGNFSLNSLSTHILQSTNTGYTYDLIRVRSKNGPAEEFWYALYVRLVSKNSADTIYEVEWDKTDLDAGFTPAAEAVGTFHMNGDAVGFRMTNRSVARPNGAEKDLVWANRTFTGTVDGVSATLRSGSDEQFTLYVDGTPMFSGLRASSLTNGYADYETGKLFLYNMTATADTAVFSYLFLLDTDTNTFEIAARDCYYGLYVCEDRTLFLDGYGTGLMSFGTKDYTPTSLTYTVRNGELSVTYRKTGNTFDYGTGATYSVSPLLNRLTVRTFTGAEMTGKTFVNTVITDGALVEIPDYTICDSSQSNGKTKLYDLVRIVTKDGEMSLNEKKACMNVSMLYFGSSSPAFCQFTVTVKVGGVDTVAYYAVFIPSKLTGEAAALARNYGSGLVDPNNTLKLNEFGQVTFTVNGVAYTGFARFTDSGFYASLRNEDGVALLVTASQLANGTLAVQTSGAVSGGDVFTVSPSGVAASRNGYLRYIKTSDENLLFFFSESAGGIGRLVTVEPLAGTDPLATGVSLLLKSGDSEIACLRVTKWGDTRNGVLLSDSCRGVYRIEKLKATLSLDGFGKGTLVGDADQAVQTLIYRVNTDGTATLLRDGKDTLYVVRTDSASGIATIEWNGDNQALLSGKTYAGTYSFICGNAMYDATTTLRFEAGQVRILSESESHDSGEEPCLDDSYDPSAFCGIGTYSVTGDEITVVIKGVRFVFRIADVRYATQLVCISTTLSQDTHGFFGSGVVFEA